VDTIDLMRTLAMNRSLFQCLSWDHRSMLAMRFDGMSPHSCKSIVSRVHACERLTREWCCCVAMIRYVRHADAAATILYALGLPQPSSWRGMPITEAITDAVTEQHHQQQQQQQQQQQRQRLREAKITTVVLLGISGLPSKALSRVTLDQAGVSSGAAMLNLRWLLDQSQYWLDARGVLPSTPLPNWASILYGVGPEVRRSREGEWNLLASHSSIVRECRSMASRAMSGSAVPTR